MSNPRIESPWAEVHDYLAKNGVVYPWTPRQTLKALLERDIANEALSLALRQIEALCGEEAADGVREKVVKGQVNAGLLPPHEAEVEPETKT